MPDSLFETQVFGDGVLTIPPLPKEDKEMPDTVDLSPNVANDLLTGIVGDINANTRDGRNLGTAAIGSLTAGIAKAHNELDAVEAAANARIQQNPPSAP